jgi:hypothetical protein
LEQLRQENAALQEQLQQAQATAASGAGPSHGKAGRKADKEHCRKAASSSAGGNADKLLQLNVSGTAMHVPLSVVMQVGGRPAAAV